MKVLVLNCGSSSLKFQLFDMDQEDVVAKGVVEKIGSSEAILTYAPAGGDKMVQTREILNHEVALNLVFNTLMHRKNGVIKSKSEIGAIGHRVVHGGEEFIDSVKITDRVKDGVRRCIQFAPLHNPHNLKGIEVCEELLEGIPQVAVFDTAFHHTLPPKSYMYALPVALYRKLRIRRYGFHGTSHAFVAAAAAARIGTALENLKLVTCHLGNGCSIAAVDRGESVETSMGFTPLEGLVMGTRCGDLDPALVTYIAQTEGMSLKQVDNLLNKQSGMLGLTETSNDLREIQLQAEHGSEEHRLALDIFCHRVSKYIGSYAAVMGGLDAVVFTAGIGEKSSYVRKHCLENLGFLGVEIDDEKNENNQLDIGKGRVRVQVVPTNEELAIARATERVLAQAGAREEVPPTLEAPVADEAVMSADDKAELASLWVASPDASAGELAEKLSRRINRTVSVRVVKQELELWGFDRVSAEKKAELLSRDA
jgi:acetate kinase